MLAERRGINRILVLVMVRVVVVDVVVVFVVVVDDVVVKFVFPQASAAADDPC